MTSDKEKMWDILSKKYYYNSGKPMPQDIIEYLKSVHDALAVYLGNR